MLLTVTRATGVHVVEAVLGTSPVVVGPAMSEDDRRPPRVSLGEMVAADDDDVGSGDV